MMRLANILLACAAGLGAAVAAPAQTQAVKMSLEDCRNMAVKQSEDLKTADNKVMQSQLDRGVARTSCLPKLDGTAMSVYQTPSTDMMGMKMVMHGMYMAGFTLTQPVYTGGKITAGNALAEIGVSSAQEQQRQMRMNVIADASNAYWNYIAVGRKIRMLETYERQLDTVYQQTHVAVKAGMATENDFMRINAKRSDIKYQLQRAKNGADLCRMQLCNLTGLAADAAVEPSDTAVSVTPPPGLTTDISQRPEMHLLQQQIDARRLQIKTARADYLPTVALMAGYTFYGNIKTEGTTQDASGNAVKFSQNMHNDGLSVMATVKVPIFSWGEGAKKVKKARLDLDNAQLSLQKNTRLLNIGARQAVLNLEDGYRMVQSATVGLHQAEESLRSMQNRYDAHLNPLTDLLDAQSQWQQSQSNLIEAQTQYKIYETEYLHAVGRL